MSSPSYNEIALKVGIFGPQGSGKSTTAGLLAAALSAEVYNRAPVYVDDPELAWQFLKRRVFDVEGIQLIQRTDKNFRAMTEGLREAEKLGACVWIVDPLTLMWNELLESFHAKTHGRMDYGDWADLKGLWKYDYTDFFLNTKMSCIACGRLGDVRQDIQDEKNPEKTRSVKVGTQFKAGGSESFGYEPHLLIEMSLERKAKVKAGSRLEGEGRIVHRGDVLKDRTWALNGKVLRWSDKAGYQKGGYRQVWESIKPHFEEVQASSIQPIITPGSTQSVLDDNGDSVYAADQRERRSLVEDWDATLDLLWGGRTDAAKEMRQFVGEQITRVRSRTRFEHFPLPEIEHCVMLLWGLEQRIKAEGMPADKKALLAMLDLVREEVVTGKKPQKTALEVLGEESLARIAGD